jgi:tetratricopeptide (TPR) repeat protein
LNEALLCISDDQNEKAVKILKKDLEKNRSPRQYNMLSMCYINSHKYALAKKLAEKMLEYKETRLSGILSLINWGLFKNDAALTEKYFSELKKLKIEDEDDLEKVVGILTATNNHALVEEYVLKLLEFRPYDPEYLYDYACALHNMGRQDEARDVYKRIYSIYGDSSRAQFFLKGGKKMSVYYNAPLPFEYFNLLSEEFDAAERGEHKILLDSPESLELLYLSLMVDGLRKDVLDYLLTFRDEKDVRDILKRFFLDINGSVAFKEYAAFSLIALETPFEFVFIARDGYGVMNYDGNTSITENRHLNGAYVYLLLRLLFHCGWDGPKPVETEKYKDYFIKLENRINMTDENSEVKSEDFRSERGLAAAAFYRANDFGRGDGERVARLFDVSSATLRKFLKLLDKLFE